MPAFTPKRNWQLAYLSPMPPAGTGIADYSALLLPALTQYADCTLFADNYPTAQPLSAYPAQRFNFDATIYQMGNSRHHAGIYTLFRQNPSILVLHDTILHHFISDITAGQGNFPAYTHELSYEMGVNGSKLATAIQFQQAEHPLFEQPLNQRLLDLSLGIIVHSQFAKQLLLEQTSRPVYVIKHLAIVPDFSPIIPATELGLPANTLFFGCFGAITPARQMVVTLSAFQQVRQTLPNAHLLIVGSVKKDVNLQALIQQAGVGKYVSVLGRVPELPAFHAWMTSIDVLINLRYPTAGETSGIAINGMALGRPQIVTDVGWYREMPAEACCKIPPNQPENLAVEMIKLGRNAELRHQMGDAAQRYILQNHTPEQIARAYLQAVESFLERFYAG